MLELNTPAPDFTLTDDSGAERRLSAEAGTYVVLYFYPQDDTPGCTAEACAIRDIYDEFGKRGVTVFGVSRDDVASHAAFKAKYELPFSLLSDEDGGVSMMYEAISPEAPDAPAARITYLIDPEGTIAQVYPDVTPTEHAHELLKDIDELQSE